MAPLANPYLHHLALTVTDLDASVEWYQAVFNLKIVLEVPHEGGTGILLSDDDRSLGIVLHRHDVNDGSQFSERRTGMDHIGLAVMNRAELVKWQEHLAANGVVRSDEAATPLTQSPIADEPYGSILVMRDPDNIQLEFFSPPES